jgi:regulator of sigma E protease
VPLSKLFISLSSNLTLTIVGILGIGFIIGFHELGHFICCKIFSIHTPRFSIGFGPRLWSKKIGATEFSIAAIPLGGYVEMATESPKGPHDPSLFSSKPYYQKLLVTCGGIAFNLLFAYFVLCFIFMAGLPKTPFLYPIGTKPIVSEIKKNSAAEKAGLLVGDKIIAINQETIGDNAAPIHKILKPLAGKPTNFLIERADKQQTITIIPDSQTIFGTTYGSIGTIYELTEKPGLPFFSAIGQGIHLTNTYLINTVKAYAHTLAKRDTQGLGGPIMIIQETVKGAASGFAIFVLFLAIISINLAVLNLIPLPILDGGQALLFTIEAIIRKQLPERAKEIIFLICWAGMILLFIYLSAKDILRIISPFFSHISAFFGK